ncbi:MAG TPA: sporulation protein [Allosphingosinicella sp.]|jgi:sporulation-control protein|uniref:sporulation protein n=1 Tax=Allosphingosinicella sp. TaxID=2823234 RepID=UPI002F282434
MALKSILGRLGLGGAQIDAILDDHQIEPGDTVSGTLHIRGGEDGKTASRAVIEIVARVVHRMGDDEHHVDEAIAGVQIPGPFPLGRDHEVPFSIELPLHAPVTSIGGQNFVWLRSGLDVPWAIDPSDTDGLEVFPNQAQANVLHAMESLGFRLAKVDIEPRSSWFGRKWVQEFEFRPTHHGQFRFDEVEIVFENQRGSQVELLMQLDRSARGLGGFLMELTDRDESWIHAHVDASSAASAAASLRHALG